MQFEYIMCNAIRDAFMHIAKILPELQSCKMRSVIKEVDVFVRSATVSWHFTITAHNAEGVPFGVVEERETFVSSKRPTLGHSLEVIEIVMEEFIHMQILIALAVWFPGAAVEAWN